MAIVRGQEKHKLGRLHCMCATVREAAAVCEAHHSNRRWRPGQAGCQTWFARHVPDGHGAFAQFWQGLDIHILWQDVESPRGNSRPFMTKSGSAMDR